VEVAVALAEELGAMRDWLSLDSIEIVAQGNLAPALAHVHADA
jgi:uncharacterized protein YcaQ